MPSTPARSDAGIHASSSAHARRAVGQLRLVERRRNQQHSESPMTVLEQLPALVALDRIAVPLVAIAYDGSILFANTAFAKMVGFEPAEVLSLRFHRIFHRVPTSKPPLSVVHALTNMVVELAHNDGSIVRALMSRSDLVRDDRFALAAFQDLTQQLWEEERQSPLDAGLDLWVDEARWSSRTSRTARPCWRK